MTRPAPQEISENQLHARTVVALDMHTRTRGNEFDRMRLALKAALEAEVCDGCGTTESIEQIKASHPTAFSCCPERNLIPLVTIR